MKFKYLYYRLEERLDYIFNVRKTADEKIAERIFVIEQKLAQGPKLQWSVKVF